MRIKTNWDEVKEFFAKKETISLILIVGFVLAVLTSMFISPQFYQSSIHEGDVALKDVYAPYDFTYYWGEDEIATKKAIEEATKDLPYMLYRDLGEEEAVASNLETFFSSIEEAKNSETSMADKIELVRYSTATKLPDRTIKTLIEYEDISQLADKSASITEKIFLGGYISEEDLTRLEELKAENLSIEDKSLGAVIRRSPSALLDDEKARLKIQQYVAEDFASERKVRAAIESLLEEEILPNLVLDEKTTIENKETIIAEFPPVLRSWEIKKNETIVEKGERITARHIAQISETRSFFRPGKSPKFFLGILLLFVLLGLVAVIHTSFTQRKGILSNTKEIGIVLINMLIISIISDLIIRSPQPSYFIPMASIAMILTLLIDFNVAFLTVILMSTWIAMIIGGKIEIMLTLLAGSCVGMFVVKGARRRGNILWAGLFVGATKFIAVVCIGLINSMDVEFFVNDGLWALASGIFSGFIVMGILPVFEFFFKTPTNISLLELSDMNHPLLKELAMEAPGTYHHSIMVGNLAEAACDTIGANSLLARVGSYYHDIGKITKAEYFSENEMGAKSKHEKLTPQMSTLIISNHVKEGVERARKHKLNSTIVNFIEQHHGDSLIAYFYQKALERVESGQDVDERNFRYPGPRPQTKECAIVLMADAVEASSRALDDPTPASIRNLVKKIVNNKFIDGQLDECDLTLRDVHVIAESFVRVLMGVFHTRLKYPEDKKISGDDGLDTAISEAIEGKKEKGENGDKGKREKPKPKKKS